jgi:hypothetical protein
MTTLSANKAHVDGKFQHPFEIREKFLYWLTVENAFSIQYEMCSFMVCALKSPLPDRTFCVTSVKP